MKIFAIVLTLVGLLLLSSCSEPDPSSKKDITGHRLNYYHDEVHGVGIWTLVGNGPAIAVLPDSQFNNPTSPMHFELKEEK